MVRYDVQRCEGLSAVKGQDSSSRRTVTRVTRRPVSAQYKAEPRTAATSGHLGLSIRGGTSDHRKGQGGGWRTKPGIPAERWGQMSFNAPADLKGHDSVTSASCSRNY